MRGGRHPLSPGLARTCCVAVHQGNTWFGLFIFSLLKSGGAHPTVLQICTKYMYLF